MVPSAGARFNLNTTVGLLRWAYRGVTVSLRMGNTLVTERRFLPDLVSGHARTLKLKLQVTVSAPASYRKATVTPTVW